MSDGSTYECKHGTWVETCVECDKETIALYNAQLEAERLRTKIISEKANNLARLVEQLAYAPVAGYYEQQGNDAPLRLLRLAVEDIDNLTKKGGARG